MRRHGGNLKAYKEVEVAHLEKQPTVWFHYMTFWKRENYGDSKKGEWLPGVRERVKRTADVCWA